MSGLQYKGYAARVEFDAEDEIFVGHIAVSRILSAFMPKPSPT